MNAVVLTHCCSCGAQWTQCTTGVFWGHNYEITTKFLSYVTVFTLLCEIITLLCKNKRLRITYFRENFTILRDKSGYFVIVKE